MNEDFIPRPMDYSSRHEILDLQFIITDLVEIPITEAEHSSASYFDAMSLANCQEGVYDTSVPLGKLVR
jgi:hypothetical protein